MRMGTALITGATSGLGEEFAWQLAGAGHNIVLVARREEPLKALADRIHWVAGVRTETIAADVATREGLALVTDRLDNPLPTGTASPPLAGIGDAADEAPVGLLVNNAGFALGKPFLDNDLDAEEYGMDAMVRAVMVLSHHAGRSMVTRGHGAILNVASMAGMTGMGVYGAHKAWVRSFTEALAQELQGTGVTATEVSPGPVPTNFHQRTGLDYSRLPWWAWTSAEQVVTEALQAVRRGQVHVTPGVQYKAAAAATRVAPRSLVHKITRLFPHL